MKIYHYNEFSGALMADGVADESPLEPGVFLIPAHATAEQPPTPGPGQFAAWNGAAWGLKDEPAPLQ
ncbi:MAG: hypothetical protein WB542_18195 [Polaromonas sp.]